MPHRATIKDCIGDELLRKGYHHTIVVVGNLHTVQDLDLNEGIKSTFPRDLPEILATRSRDHKV
jgi:hypothetical protein